MGSELPRRFIPTCVGRFPASRTASATRSVHPHVRGAVCVSVSGHCHCSGSSPRAWGGWRTWLATRSGRRFIPTCVGRLSAPSASSARRRFIPTCVGRLGGKFFSHCLAPVHPHVRGAVQLSAAVGTCVGGSSPRAWGGYPLHRRPRHYLRFIPTCVGRLREYRAEGELELVHPHVRGAVMRARYSWYSLDGSSPRAWGG